MTRQIRLIEMAVAFALAFVVAGLFGGGFPPVVHAASGAGFPDSFDVTCATTATKIQSTKGQMSYMCQVDSGASASVVIGDSGVTATTGPAFAASADFGGNLRYEYCIVSSGTVTVHCRAQVSSE